MQNVGFSQIRSHTCIYMYIYVYVSIIAVEKALCTWYISLLTDSNAACCPPLSHPLERETVPWEDCRAAPWKISSTSWGTCMHVYICIYVYSCGLNIPYCNLYRQDESGRVTEVLDNYALCVCVFSVCVCVCDYSYTWNAPCMQTHVHTYVYVHV